MDYKRHSMRLILGPEDFDLSALNDAELFGLFESAQKSFFHFQEFGKEEGRFEFFHDSLYGKDTTPEDWNKWVLVSIRIKNAPLFSESYRSLSVMSRSNSIYFSLWDENSLFLSLSPTTSSFRFPTLVFQDGVLMYYSSEKLKTVREMLIRAYELMWDSVKEGMKFP